MRWISHWGNVIDIRYDLFPFLANAHIIPCSCNKSKHICSQLDRIGIQPSMSMLEKSNNIVRFRLARWIVKGYFLIDLSRIVRKTNVVILDFVKTKRRYLFRNIKHIFPDLSFVWIYPFNILIILPNTTIFFLNSEI